MSLTRTPGEETLDLGNDSVLVANERVQSSSILLTPGGIATRSKSPEPLTTW
jgi:hypothetical protein